MLSILNSCFGCGDESSPLEPEVEEVPEIYHKLHVSVTEGLTGTPDSTTAYKAGEVVYYSYTALAGYHHEYVVLDSTFAPMNGSFVMDREKRLTVRAEKKPVVPPEDAPAMQAARAMLTSTDKVGAARKYFEEISKLYTQYGRAEGLSRARAVAQTRMEETSFAQAVALEAALGGQVFTPGTSTSGYTGGMASAGTEVVFLDVDGMFNSREDASLMLLETTYLTQEMGLPFPTSNQLFHNSSYFREMSPSAYCFIRYGLQCFTGALSDANEALAQLLQSVHSLDTKAVEEAVALAAHIDGILRSGKAVVVLAHSQGTLMVQQALREFGNPRECVAVVALGAPGSMSNWNVSEGNLSSVVTKGSTAGDFVLRLKLNNSPQLSSSLTREADRLVSEAVPLMKPLILIEQEWLLHGFSLSYLGALETRAHIRNLLSQQAYTLSANPNCVPKEVPTMYAVSGPGTSNFGSSDLWVVQASKEGVDSLVGRVRTASGAGVLFSDIAESPSGELWGTSFAGLYKITVDGSNVLAEGIAGYHNAQYGMNALAFRTDNELYAANTNTDEVIGVNLSPLGIFWSGRLGDGYTASGDLVFSPDGRLIAVIRNRAQEEFLASVDLTTGKPTVLCKIPYGTSNVWGLKYIGDQLYGLTASSSNRGVLIKIGLESSAECSTSTVRILPFSAFGAAVRH